MPCGVEISVWLPKGWDYVERIVKCGNTSPSGDPYLCDDCAFSCAGTDWQAEAEANGERYDEDY